MVIYTTILMPIWRLQMTDIMKLAKRAGLEINLNNDFVSIDGMEISLPVSFEVFKRFAELIRQDERETYVQICNNLKNRSTADNYDDGSLDAIDAIRSINIGLPLNYKDIVRFAEIVRLDEQKICIQICSDSEPSVSGENDFTWDNGVDDCADAIRKRGT